MTLSLFIPAFSGAGPEQRERLFATSATGLVIDGSEVVASLDHALVDAGATLHLSLHASQRVKLGVVALERNSLEGFRVPEPPVEVLYKQITLDGGADIPISLSGQSFDGFGDYTIFVMKPGDARALHRMARAAHFSTPPPPGEGDLGTVGEGTFELIRHIAEIDDNGAILLEAWARPVDPAVVLTMPDHAPAGEPFEVTAVLTNPTKRTMKGLEVMASVPEIGSGDATREIDSHRADYLGLRADAVVIDDVDKLDLAPHEKRTVTLHVTAKRPGVLGLQVRASCGWDNPDCKSDGHLATGTFDAVDITEPAEHILAGG